MYRMSADWREMRQMKGNLEGREFLVESEETNPNWLQDYIHPDDQVRVWAEIQEAIRGKRIFELEHRSAESTVVSDGRIRGLCLCLMTGARFASGLEWRAT